MNNIDPEAEAQLIAEINRDLEERQRLLGARIDLAIRKEALRRATDTGTGTDR